MKDGRAPVMGLGDMIKNIACRRNHARLTPPENMCLVEGEGPMQPTPINTFRWELGC